MKTNAYAPLVLRVALALVFLWFGAEQLLHAAQWTIWVPEWALALTGLSAETVVLVNGVAETALAVLLALGFFTRLAALLLALHTLLVAFDVGLTAIGMRDFGLAASALALALAAPDFATLDAWRARRRMRTAPLR